MGFSEAIC